MEDRSAVARAMAPRRVRTALRSFATKKAADRFDRRVKDLRAAGELHLLDESPRGSVTLYDYTYDVWWPQYAEMNLSDETRATTRRNSTCGSCPSGATHPRERSSPVRSRRGCPAAEERRRRRDDPEDAAVLPGDPQARRARPGDRPQPDRLVAKPKQEPKRAPRPIAPYLVERIRALMLDPPPRRDSRGRRIPARDPLLREMDATLVSVLAYAGPRPESEALPLTFEQIGRRTITFRATKSGVVVERETGCSSRSAATCAAGGCGARRPMMTSCFRPQAASGGAAATGTTGASGSSSRPRSRSACHATPARATCGAASPSLLIYEGVESSSSPPELGHSPGHLPELLRPRLRGVQGPPVGAPRPT